MLPTRSAVLIADDSAFVRVTLLDLIIGQPDMYVVGSLPNHAQALALALQTPADVLITDIRPQEGGIEGIRMLREQLPMTPLVVWSTSGTEQEFAACREVGAAACLGKDHAPQELLATIRQVAHSLHQPQFQSVKQGET